MQPFYDFEKIKGWHGKHHCRITPVCKDNYSTIKERVEIALASQRAMEPRHTSHLAHQPTQWPLDRASDLCQPTDTGRLPD